MNIIEELLADFDEMKFMPTEKCENPEEYAKDYRKRLEDKLYGLQTENEILTQEKICSEYSPRFYNFDKIDKLLVEFDEEKFEPTLQILPPEFYTNPKIRSECWKEKLVAEIKCLKGTFKWHNEYIASLKDENEIMSNKIYMTNFACNLARGDKNFFKETKDFLTFLERLQEENEKK